MDIIGNYHTLTGHRDNAAGEDRTFYNEALNALRAELVEYRRRAGGEGGVGGVEGGNSSSGE